VIALRAALVIEAATEGRQSSSRATERISPQEKIAAAHVGTQGVLRNIPSTPACADTQPRNAFGVTSDDSG